MKFLEKEWKGRSYSLYAQREGHLLWIHYRGRTWCWRKKKPRPKPSSQSLKQSLLQASLPGRIQKLFVKKGDKVKRGQTLLILSAMKIEYSFKAEGEGQVEELFCSPHQTVTEGQKLIKIKYY